MFLPSLSTIAQWAGIVMPTLYAGVAFQYSLTMSLLARTSPHPDAKLLATQWLAIYQQGPRWVPPLLWPGILANAYLAYLTFSHRTVTQPLLYLTSALLTFSILPYTFLHLEPGINGACKWRVQRLLHGDGFRMPPAGDDPGGFGALVREHTASAASRRQGEEADMAALVREWAWQNQPRWVVGVVAGAVSFAAGRVGG